MNLLARLERRLEETVEGFFSRRFAGRVHPVEIARRLTGKMEEGAVVSVSHVYAPNVYRIYLHPRDYEPFAAWRGVLVAELCAYLEGQAAAGGLRFPGPLGLTVEARDEVSPGQIQIQAELAGEVEPRSAAPGPAGPESGRVAAPVSASPPAPPAMSPRTGLAAMGSIEETKVFVVPRERLAELIVQDGEGVPRRLELTQPSVTIGRRKDCELVLRDPRASRLHARIDVTPDGHLLTDLSSTNGTTVNGERVQRHPLRDRDVILIGGTTLEYRLTAPTPSPGT